MTVVSLQIQNGAIACPIPGAGKASASFLPPSGTCLTFGQLVDGRLIVPQAVGEAFAAAKGKGCRIEFKRLGADGKRVVRNLKLTDLNSTSLTFEEDGAEPTKPATVSVTPTPTK